MLTYANGVGIHKCRLLVIEKSAKPRALKGMKTMPVIYKASKHAMATSELINDWYTHNFVPKAHTHCHKVWLLADRKIYSPSRQLFSIPSHGPFE